MSKNPQILLNKKLNGVPVGESNDVIVEAMEDYAQSQLQELREEVEDSKATIDETIESQKLEYRHVSDWLMGNRNAYNEVIKIIDQLQGEQHNE